EAPRPYLHRKFRPSRYLFPALTGEVDAVVPRAQGWQQGCVRRGIRQTECADLARCLRHLLLVRQPCTLNGPVVILEENGLAAVDGNYGVRQYGRHPELRECGPDAPN